ncbi:hypothetical protein D3C71_1923160 [compost metagenome]
MLNHSFTGMKYMGIWDMVEEKQQFIRTTLEGLIQFHVITRILGGITGSGGHGAVNTNMMTVCEVISTPH